MKPIAKTAASLAILALAACGGGGTSGAGGTLSYDAQLADLQRNFPTSINLTKEKNMPRGGVRYDGVAAFNLANADDIDPSDFTAANAQNLPVYAGALRVDAKFATDSFTGRIDNFVDMGERRVGGTVNIRNGRMTGNNAGGLGDGLTGVARGTIAGRDVVMDIDGNILGQRGRGMVLYFDQRNSLGGGVGMAAW